MTKIIKDKKLLLIFIFALLINLFALHKIPYGFHSDEVRVGWNAFSLLRTLHDDRGHLLPLYYNTFGDYRPTGIFYLSVPSIAIFGLNEFAIRFPSALLGALSIYPLSWLVFQITKSNNLKYLSAFLLTISPWWILTSRSTNEVVVSIFISLVALNYLVYSLRTNKKKFLIHSFFLFFLSFLFYHSIRVLAPVFILLTVFYYKNQLKNKKYYVFFVIAILSIVFFLLSSSSARGRFSQVSIAKKDTQVLGSTSSPLLTYAKDFTLEYFSYFSAEFLLGDTSKPIRYKTSGVGVLTFAQGALLLIGTFVALKNKKYTLILLLLAAAPLAAALTHEDSPNLNRSLMMVPFISILSAIGIRYLYKNYRPFSTLIIIFLGISFFSFWRSYIFSSAPLVGFWRNITVKDLVFYLEKEKTNYEKVIITSDPDSIYPWYAFYTHKDPKDFNNFAVNRTDGEWQYQNLVFSTRECPSGDIFPGVEEQPLGENILVVDGFKCPIESKIRDGMQAKVLKEFKNPDGSPSYTLWVKN